MTTTQREALAYACPIRGGYALGGSNAGTYTLLRWSYSDDLSTRTVRCTFWLHDTSATTRAAQLQVVRDWLEASRGNLAITAGTDRTIAVNATYSSVTRLLTLTRTSGDSFASTDVGLPVTIEGVTVAITGFTSTSVVTCRIMVGASFLPSFSGTATIGEVMLRCADQDDAGAAVCVGGLHARGSVTRTADADDDEFRRSFDVLWVFERPAAEVRYDDATRPHIRASAVSRSTNEAGLATLTFSGQITAGVVSGAGQRAYAAALIAASVDVWTAAQLSALLPGVTTEQIDPIADTWDDEGAVLSFSRSYRELNFDNTASAASDARIRGATVQFSRSYQNVHGIPGARAPFQVACTYSAHITARGNNAVTYDDIPALWSGTIKPYLAARIAAIYGGNVVVTAGADPAIEPFSSRLTASFTALVSDSGSNVYSYSRTTAMDLDEQLEDDPLYDEEDFTAVLFTAGRRLTGAVYVQVVQIGEPLLLRRGGPGAGNSLVSLPGGGVFFGGGAALAIELPAAGIFGLGGGGPSENAQNSPNSYEVYPDPGDPSRFFGPAGINITGGEWVPTGRSASETPGYWGEDPDSVGSRVQVTTTRYAGRFLYVMPSSLRDRVSRVDTGGVQRSGGGGGINSVPPGELKGPQ